MKIFFLLLTLILTLPVFAIDFVSVQELLKQKGTSLEAQSQKGNKAILGEVTGHAKSIPVSKVVVILTNDEAILNHEIEATEVSGTSVIGNIQSVRYNGQYITAQEIVGVIVAH